MKPLKTTIGILVGVALLFPAVVPAQSVTASSGASVGVQQLIALYSQLIQLLEQEIAQLQSQIALGGGVSSQQPPQPTTTTSPFSFSASPNSGQAPLFVTFNLVNAETLEAGFAYVVDFGDGSRGTMTASGSAGSLTASHTYTAGGTFNAILYEEINLCGGVDSYGCVSDLQVGSVSITANPGNQATATQVLEQTPATTNQPTSTSAGGSCIAYNRTYTNESATAYPNGTTLWSICSPDYNGPCPLVAGVDWICTNGQWQALQSH